MTSIDNGQLDQDIFYISTDGEIFAPVALLVELVKYIGVTSLSVINLQNRSLYAS